jgi:alkanesulfonate monooxygenase SsuD/methylene tetrahydromethanopterin reductase-like flavin-dependent oxidoreductase (luciferase family)
MPDVSATSPVLARVGTYLFAWGKTPPTIESATALAQHAERVGLDSLHTVWHFTLEPRSFNWGNRQVLDPFVLLPFVAARTERIKLALDPWTPAVMHPYFWAKFFATLDHASGGRAMAGLRESLNKDDFAIGNADLTTATERFNEGLELIRKLWSGKTLEKGDSKLWDVDGLRLEPLPLHDIPVWIGVDENVGVDLAARLGDYLRPLFATVDDIRELRAKLDKAQEKHARKVGIVNATLSVVLEKDDKPEWIRDQIRPLIEKRLRGRSPDTSMVFGEPEQCAQQVVDFVRSGVDYFLLDMQFHGWESETYAREQIDRFTQLVAPLIKASDLK